MGELSFATIKRIMYAAGAERISDDAVDKVSEEVVAFIIRLTEEAIFLADHANRKTVMAVDIEAAAMVTKSVMIAELSLAAIKRIMRAAGADRIANNAIDKVSEKAVAFIIRLTEEAIFLADHANRKTVMAVDIEAVTRKDEIEAWQLTEAEAQRRSNLKEAHRRAEEEARRRSNLEEARRRAEEEARRRAEGELFASLRLLRCQGADELSESSATGSPSKPRPSYGDSGDVRELIEAMIIDATESHMHALIQELSIMGEKMISYVKSFGVQIIVLERNSKLTQKRIRGMMIVAPGERSSDGRPWEVVRGVYCQDRRLIVIGEELLGMKVGSAARNMFAYAFDHAFTSRNQRRLPLSIQLWNWFSKERKALTSEYASTNPAAYFAESVDAYFINEGKSYLERNDPQMFEYLAVLFK